MRVCVLVLTMAWVVGLAPLAFADEPAALAKARSLYNAGSYDQAIESAAVARRQAEWADAAGVVAARAHLERYRAKPDPADLTAARETLAGIRAAALTPRDQVDLLVGLGQALYLEETYGAAAELFDTALSRDTLLSPRDRVMLLDWWATALDREAQGRTPERRVRVFERVLERMETELRRDPASVPANYWLAAAARGTGDLDRAWAAAVAAWIRAGLGAATATTLRADVDRLVTQVLVPERARQRPAREQAETLAALRAEWEGVKQQWK